SVADLADVAAFDLRLGGRSLGSVSLRPVPVAQLTSEGGFEPPGEYAWTPAAEEEITERLGRLLGGHSPGGRGAGGSRPRTARARPAGEAPPPPPGRRSTAGEAARSTATRATPRPAPQRGPARRRRRAACRAA